MQKIASFLMESVRLLGSIGLADVVDILIIAVGIYWLIGFIRRTNSTRVATAIVLLVLALWLSGELNLSMTNYVLKTVFDIGVLAVLILFQPEVRRALERWAARVCSSSAATRSQRPTRPSCRRFLPVRPCRAAIPAR